MRKPGGSHPANLQDVLSGAGHCRAACAGKSQYRSFRRIEGHHAGILRQRYGDEVDVKRVNINLENLKVQYDNAQAMMEQQLNLLKYIIDYPAGEAVP